MRRVGHRRQSQQEKLAGYADMCLYRRNLTDDEAITHRWSRTNPTSVKKSSPVSQSENATRAIKHQGLSRTSDPKDMRQTLNEIGRRRNEWRSSGAAVCPAQ